MKKKDYLYNGITYLSAFIGVFVLLVILVYVFSKGFSTLSWQMLTNDYWSKNYLVAPISEKTDFPLVEVDGYYSQKWGIGLQDDVTVQKVNIIEVTYLAEESPLTKLTDLSSGAQNSQIIELQKGYQIEKIEYVDLNGNIQLTGKIMSENAQQVISKLDNEAVKINSIYFKTIGGGIKGSLIATLYLILISLALALPIGVASAIYLQEYASKNYFNKLIRQGIELLTGVPSIVYGLMGVTVLFPITQILGASTTSILLGGLTMAVILLPTIIKSTQEAIIVVPKELKDASLSLGATKAQTVFKVTLPCCIDGILTGVLLSIGRVIGESAALIYTMGTFISDSPEVLKQATSLALMIYSAMSNEQPNFQLACAISIIILVIVLTLNIIVKMIGRKLARRFN